MNARPGWTIAIPTFDGAEFLCETLRSVLAQTDADFELLICDDGSRDGTVDLVHTVCGDRARILGNESGQPRGLAGNWNRCVTEASGAWITILHQDDLIEPGFLAKHRRVATDHGEIGLIAGPVAMIDSIGKKIETGDPDFVWPDRFVVWPPHELSRILVKGNPIRCPGVSFRKELHQRLRGFDGRWKYVLDWDFWYRAGQAAPVAFIGEMLAKQRWHPASETWKLARGTIDLEENARLMRTILACEPFGQSERPAIEAKICERMARAWISRAYQAACRGDRRIEFHALKQAWSESWFVSLGRLVREPRTIMRLLLGRSRKRSDS